MTEQKIFFEKTFPFPEMNLLQRLPIPFLLLRQQKNDGLLIEWVNDAFADFVDRPASDLLGKSFTELFECEEPPFDPIGEITQILHLPNQDGLAQLKTFSLGDDYFVGLIQDITELEHARERAEQASHAKTDFLARMSHEIRTPMNGILGLTTLALSESKDKRITDYLGRIKESADDLLGIINDILDYSKLQDYQVSVKKEPFLLKRIFEKSASLFAPRAREKGLQLYHYLDERLAEAYEGDPLRLGQVLNNLLSNAIKYTSRGDVRLSAAPSEEGLLFSISDTGMGMDKSFLSRVFEPFVQADDARTRSQGGSGLGMTITKQLIELMGGRIWVESRPGVGTTVFFTLPLSPCDTSLVPIIRPEAEETLFSRRYPGRALVVEDNGVNQMVAQMFLERAGLTVDLADSGAKAIRLAFANHYDLILMDLHMPKMSGTAAAKMIRDSGNETPIIAVTADVMSSLDSGLEAYGINGVLIKPFTADQLEQILSHYLHSEGNASASFPVLEHPAADCVLDSEAALRRINGDQVLYGRILENFLLEYRPIAADWETLKQAHPESFYRAVHTLKSVASNIGANRLSTLCGQLQEALCRGESAGLLADDVKKELQSVLASAEPLIQVQNKLLYQTGRDNEAGKKLTGKLMAVLREHGLEAQQLIPEAYRTLYTASTAPLLEKLAVQIDNYDFSDAQHTLEEITETLRRSVHGTDSDYR